MKDLEVKQFQKIAGILKEENSFGNIAQGDNDMDMSDDDKCLWWHSDQK